MLIGPSILLKGWPQIVPVLLSIYVADVLEWVPHRLHMRILTVCSRPSLLIGHAADGL
jgi:hypothetical protein